MPEATIALVTGASRGIGSAVCLALARAGVTVGVGYRSDPEGAEETVAKARADGGMALSVAVEDGRIKRGDLVLMEAMGGGFTWGATLLRW